MSLFREVFSGYARRVRLENDLQLQKNEIVRPMQIKMEAAVTVNAINQQLKDAELKAVYDGLKIEVRS